VNQPQPSVTGAKSPSLALSFNFFIPGSGHLYASGGTKGWGLLIGNLLLGMTVPFVYVTFLGNVIIWIYAMATAGGVARDYNRQLEAALEQQRASRAADALLVRGAQLAEEFRKLASLRKINVLSEEEFTRQRSAVVEGLIGRRTTESLGEFFVPLAALIESGELRTADIDRLKVIHGSILVAS
jgi:hypothetical protein